MTNDGVHLAVLWIAAELFQACQSDICIEGVHTGVQYSRRGRTYVQKALTNNVRSREEKQRSIKLALA